MNAPLDHNATVESRIEALSDKVDLLLDRQRAMSELVSESGPILTAMMDAGTRGLGEWEERGYFAFGRSTLRLLDRVATSYSSEDVDELGDAVVGILDTVRNLTQSDVLNVANEATDVLHRADALDPVGVVGAIRKSKDEDIQRGLAVMLEVLRTVGKAAQSDSGATPGQRRLASRLAPSGRRAARPVTRSAPRRRPAARSASPAAAGGAPKQAQGGLARWACVTIPGHALDSGGFLVDPQTWNREFAVLMAAEAGIGELTDEHWQVVDAMRAHYLSVGASPNVRKLANLSGLGTKAIYQLFKKAPGSTAARVAGVPKPVGCI
ncbi:MAG: TusE/DsrC/DsvC family sulfur relay protein [Deltaproteobacteria bacterium]|nr:TusE/DsrC/DsvC family sulfur relay protein [Deltaproteobacteria bacterium]